MIPLFALRWSVAGRFVAENVMEEAGRLFTEAEAGMSPETENESQKGPLDSLKRDLDKAVAEERYEEAAKIRDEIKRMENMHTEN